MNNELTIVMSQVLPARFLKIRISAQQCDLWQDNQCLFSAPVSTALKGAGEANGSEKTPRGWHQIRARIGEDMPINTVFRGRRPTGEIYSEDLAASQPGRDWILTRILWLSGLEPGKNRFGNVDSMRRYIYIHGTPDTEPMGQPRSHGCIRMHNDDVMQLFSLVTLGMPVLIEA